jgi:hypothetical protein
MTRGFSPSARTSIFSVQPPHTWQASGLQHAVSTGREVMIGDRPLAWRVAKITPNRAGRKCPTDSLLKYARQYHFDFQGAATRYTEKYAHCLAWMVRHEPSANLEPSSACGVVLGCRLAGPREASVRWIGILGLFAALISNPADAFDEFKTCPDLLEGAGATAASPANGEQALLLENRCEAVKREELRASLMRIPQEDEDPMELSFGVKSNGGMLRFKVPFSF